jgi:hypothetical protein
MTLPRKRTAVLIILVFAVSAAALGATLGDNGDAGKRNPATKVPPGVSGPAKAQPGYWTKKRMRDAKPYPMPHAPAGVAPQGAGGEGSPGEPGTSSPSQH